MEQLTPHNTTFKLITFAFIAYILVMFLMMLTGCKTSEKLTTEDGRKIHRLTKRYSWTLGSDKPDLNWIYPTKTK